METTALLGLLTVLAGPPGPLVRWGWAAVSFACLPLLRVTYATSGAILLIWDAGRARRWAPVLVGIPAAALLALHLANNASRHGDPLHSIHLHTYFYANMEFVGRPGFHATEEERAKDVYRKSLTYREWAFVHHTPWEYLGGTAVGYGRFFWTFFSRVYFRVGLPSVVTGILLIWYGLAGGTAMFHRTGRRVLVWIVCLVFPYAFVGHVFWAGRFFIPFTPLALLLMGQGAVQLCSRIKRMSMARRHRGPRGIAPSFPSGGAVD